jgi:hypothetical protein
VQGKAKCLLGAESKNKVIKEELQAQVTQFKNPMVWGLFGFYVAQTWHFCRWG